MNGFVILAHNREKYLRFAVNLAASLKIYSKFPVCLVIDQKTHDETGIKLARWFDHVRILKKAHNIPFYAKTVINQYSPFDHSIYLDADTLCIASPDHLFEESADFDTHVMGIFSYEKRQNCSCAWAPTADLWKFYEWAETAHYVETNSSFIRWRNTPQTARIWALYEILYAEWPYLKYDSKAFKHYPDELALNSALTFTGIQPAKSSPVHFHYYTRSAPSPQDFRGKIFLSLFGVGSTHPKMWKYYHYRMHADFMRKYKWSGFKMSNKDKEQAQARRHHWKALRSFNFQNFSILLHGPTE